MEIEPEKTTIIPVNDNDGNSTDNDNNGPVQVVTAQVPVVPAEVNLGFDSAFFLSDDFVVRFTLVQFGPDDKYDNSTLRNDLIQIILGACGLITRLIQISGDEELDGGLTVLEGYYDSEYLHLLDESPDAPTRGQIDIPILTRSFSGDNLVDLNYLAVFHHAVKRDLFSPGFIYDCSKRKQVVDLSTYRVGESLFEDYDAQELFLLNPNEDKGWNSLPLKGLESSKSSKRLKKVNQNVTSIERKRKSDELDLLLESLIEEVVGNDNANNLNKGKDNDKVEQVKKLNVSPASITITTNLNINVPEEPISTSRSKSPQIVQDKASNQQPITTSTSTRQVTSAKLLVSKSTDKSKLPQMIQVEPEASNQPTTSTSTGQVTSESESLLSISNDKDKEKIKSPKKKSILGGKKTALNRRGKKPLLDYVSDNESDSSSTTDNDLSDLDANFSINNDKDNDEVNKVKSRKTRSFRRDDISPPPRSIQTTLGPPLSPIRNNQSDQGQGQGGRRVDNQNVDYATAGPSTRTRVPGTTGQIQVVNKPKKMPFTYNESQAMVDFVCKNKCHSRVKGNTLWQQIHGSKDDPLPHRPWQSKRENFTKKVMNNLQDYRMTEKDKEIFKREYPSNKKKKKRGDKFSHEESQALVDYICENNLHALVRGKAIWEDIKPENDPLPRRTWQSKRDNFLKKIMNNLGDYAMIDADRQLFKLAQFAYEEKQRKK